MDQFVKRELKCKYYVRYVDDFVLLSRSQEELKFWRDEIDKFLHKETKIEIKPKKAEISACRKGN